MCRYGAVWRANQGAAEFYTAAIERAGFRPVEIREEVYEFSVPKGRWLDMVGLHKSNAVAS